MRLYALEVIDYQHGDRFGEDLTEIVELVFEGISLDKFRSNGDIFKSDLPKRIERLIKERFGLSVIMDTKLHHYLPAAIVPFSSDYLSNISNASEYVNANFDELFGATNIYRHIKGLEKERQDYYKRIHNKTGFFDKKYARVGGYLSEVRHYLIINFFTLKGYGLSSRETAGVISHEIGHALEGLVNHYKLMTTNSSIMEVLNDLNKNTPQKALYTFKRHFGEDSIVEADLNKDSTVVDFYPALARQYIGTLKSQMLNSKYDETNFENLSDNFATKFNLGKDLVSGLQKIHVKQGQVYEDSSLRYFASYIIEALMIALSMIILGPFGVGFFLVTVLFFSGNSSGKLVYDVPIDRYNRIKNTIIKTLSNPELPKEFATDLIKQVEYIDKVIERTRNRPAISDLVSNMILPSNREISKYIEIQQTIENNLNHRLFVQSSKLRHV